MKKIIIAITLAAMLLLCGCVADTGSVTITSVPQVSSTPEATPVPTVTVMPEPTPPAWATEPPKAATDEKTALLNVVLARAKENADTGTFEGYHTGDSTLQDVIEHTGMEINDAAVSYEADFLGYPAIMKCHFSPALSNLTFFIHPNEGTGYEDKLADVISKLDRVLGDCDDIRPQQTDDWDHGTYEWNNGTYWVSMETQKDFFINLGILAEISVGWNRKDTIPTIPDIFLYQFGTDFDTIYKNESLNTVSLGYADDVTYISYIQDGIKINFSFDKDKYRNKIIFSRGYYNFYFDISDRDAAVNLMEATADSLQNVLGKPKSRQYGTWEGQGEKTVITVKQIKQAEYPMDFWLNVQWDVVRLEAGYSPNPNGGTYHIYLGY